jgi:tetratricopeptide (TPR) repeat protein
LPQLESLVWQPLKDRGLSVLAIGREHSLAEVESYKSKLKLTMPVGADPDRSIYAKYATRSIPRNFLIDKNGKIIYTSIGFGGDDALRFKGMIEKELGLPISSPVPLRPRGEAGSPAPPPAPPSKLQLASSDISIGKYDSAITRLKEILQSSPANAQAHYMLGVAYAKTKQFVAAETEYQETIRLAGDEKLKDLARLGLSKLHPTQK